MRCRNCQQRFDLRDTFFWSVPPGIPASPRALTLLSVLAGVGVVAAAAWYGVLWLGAVGFGIVALFWACNYGIRLVDYRELNGCRGGECPNCKHVNRVMPWTGYGT